MKFGPASWVVALLTSGLPLAKEKIGFALEQEIPAENYGNKELYHEDLTSGMPIEQVMRNVRAGKYILRETHPAPHRDPKTGKVIIENSLLYNQDLREYGAAQTMKWVNQGKYNLTPEELEEERKRIEEKYDYLYSLL